MALIDALLQLRVEGVADEPPSSPEEAKCWLVSPNPQGEWTENADAIAIYSGGSWAMKPPERGMWVYDRAAKCRKCFDGSWSAADVIDAPSGGSVIDVEARQAIVRLTDVLRGCGIFPLE